MLYEMKNNSFKSVFNNDPWQFQKREALMNFSPQEQGILMVRCCSLKTQLRNFFLFINLSDRIKFTKYLELAKQDPGGGGAEGRRRRAQALFVCGGPQGENG